MLLLIIALFLSDGTSKALVFSKDAPLAECQAKAAEAPKRLLGKADGNALITGVEARCVVIPRTAGL